MGHQGHAGRGLGSWWVGPRLGGDGPRLVDVVLGQCLPLLLCLCGLILDVAAHSPGWYVIQFAPCFPNAQSLAISADLLYYPSELHCHCGSMGPLLRRPGVGWGVGISTQGGIGGISTQGGGWHFYQGWGGVGIST